MNAIEFVETMKKQKEEQRPEAQLDAHALRAFVKLLDFNEQLKNEILPILAHREAVFNLDYRIQTWLNNAQEELEKFVVNARFELNK